MELEIEDDDLSSSWILVDHIDTCPTYLKQEQPILHPVKRPDITESNINSIFKTREYRDLIADQLSGAVQIPTVTYDGMGRVGEDERWDVFYEIESYLERAFPKM
jgi:Gly-Xaa carboxypeptidase